MIGTGRDATRILTPLDAIGKFGAATLYDITDGGGGFRYSSLNGKERSQPMLHASNKNSEHNIWNMPITPGMVVKVLPRSKMSRQSVKVRSVPVKLPWQ